MEDVRAIRWILDWPRAPIRIKVWVRGTRMTLDHGRVVLNPTSILTPYRSHQSQMETLNLPAFSPRYRWSGGRNTEIRPAICGQTQNTRSSP